MKFLHSDSAKSAVMIAVFILLDQFSKYVIRSKGGFYICNATLAWNIHLPGYVVWPIWIFIMLVLVFFLYKNSRYALSVALIIAGAVSNMIDRVMHGCVVDFIDLKFWPVFNLADVAIFLGVVFLVTRRKI